MFIGIPTENDEQPTFMKQKLNLLKKIYVTRPTFAVISTSTTNAFPLKTTPKSTTQETTTAQSV